jgi:hypothetical protein
MIKILRIKLLTKVDKNDSNNNIIYFLQLNSCKRRTKMGKSQMDGLNELWQLDWVDGLFFTAMLMALYTYKVWIDNKFKK